MNHAVENVESKFKINPLFGTWNILGSGTF